MNNKSKDIAFWIMIITIILLSIYLGFFLKSESYSCMKNPLVYGVNQFSSTQGELICSCSYTNSKQMLRVSKSGITLIDYSLPYNSLP